VAGVVVDDGTYWFLYTAQGNANVVAGLVQGNSNSANGVFTSSNTKDFSIEEQSTTDATIYGNYVAKQTLNGTAIFANNAGQVQFQTTYDAEYDQTPNPNLLNGAYLGSVSVPGFTENVTVILTNGNAINGSTLLVPTT
jgi:hypothetical protein